MSQFVLPPDSLILITGVNGYIASHCADQALAAGFKVRGTVRSLEKANELVKIFEKRYGSGMFEPFVVTDMCARDAFDEAIQGCTAAMHCASILTMDSHPDKVVPQTVAGALGLLYSASRTRSIKRVVMTSSRSATGFEASGVERHVTKATWNTDAVEWIKTRPKGDGYPSMPIICYAASKTLAEQQCWDFVDVQRPHFTFNTVIPDFNTGEILDPMIAGSSGGMVRGVWNNDEFSSTFLRQLRAWHYIDVKDTARLHLAAVLFNDVQGERLFGTAGPINYNRLRDTCANIDPGRTLPARDDKEYQDLSKYETERSIELLKRLGRSGWVCLEQSIRENVGRA